MIARTRSAMRLRRVRLRLVVAAGTGGLTAAVALAAPARADQPPPPPTKAQCDAVRAHRSLPPITALARQPGAPRVFAMQFKQDLANVVTYDAFRVKIECLIIDDVVPYRTVGRPNVVSFTEDTGLAAIATGTRGAAARKLFGGPGSPGCESQGAPCGALAGL